MLFAWILTDSKYYITQSFAHRPSKIPCYDFVVLTFFFNASDKKSGPREFQKQSLQKLQWICSTSQDKAESGVKACFSASPKVCSVSVHMERRLADCVVAPCIIHVRMEL